MSPDPAKVKQPGVIYVFRGRGWRSNRTVSAGYGSYCPPSASACEDEGRSSEFRADRHGRFTFRLRDGRHVSGDVPRPAGAGGGADAIRFVQWTGRAFHSRRIARDAIPTPPLSTPARRLQARTIAATFAGAAKALHAAKPAVNRSMERYERRLGRCPDLVERADQRVVSSLRGLASEGALLRPVKPQLDALAAALERLDLEDPILGAGRDAWDAAVRRHRPWPEPDLCTVLRRWSATRFDVARAPVAPDAYDTSELTVELAGTPAVVAGAARLRELGAGRAAEEAFAGGLLDVADMMGED